MATESGTAVTADALLRPLPRPRAAATRPGPAPAPPEAHAVADASDGGARIAVIVIAAAWHLGVALPAVLRAGQGMAAPAVVALGWLVTALVGVGAGVRLLRGGLPPARSLAVALLVVDAAVVAGAGERFLFSTANWVWGGLAWFFLLALWQRPVRWLLVMLAAHGAIAVTAVVLYGATAPADLSRATMYVYGTSTLPVAVFVGAAALTAQARDRAATAAAALAVAAEREAAERARTERQERLALVSGTAEEVLAELAAGHADPADPAVRRRAVLAAARLRRLIAESDDVPDALLHELRAAADLAERNGLPIDLVAVGTPPELPVEIRRGLADPLTAALAAAEGWARLTVVAGPDEVVVSLVTPEHDGPDETTTGEGGPVEHLHERDGEIRWTQTRWRRT
ncbi:hypothetical protein [Micromonospora chalcea]|uniref:hypothetical protein n=1 Tax=Micromonospora chalcea TaxID=1874 RepID=UPI00157CC67A|nr:hypothetical protein [Micromonospora chalcea]